MVHKRGYTLVELLIIITIIAVLITFGLSAFTKAKERQLVQQSKELILSVLQNAQKSAYVGDKDCLGSLDGIQLTFSGNRITSQALCSGGEVGTAQVTEISGLTFTTSPPILFKPLEQGVDLGAGSSAQIDYTISGLTYRFTVLPPGIIRYEGAI